MSLSKLDKGHGVNVPLCKCSLKLMKDVKKNESDNDEPDSEASLKAASEILHEYKHPFKATRHYYGVSIMTGEQLDAGTCVPNVFICLVGSTGHSGKLYLTSLRKHIHRGMLDNLVIESEEDLGEIFLVILGIDKDSYPLIHGTLFVNEVGVDNRQTGNQDAFPCYHWFKCGQNIGITSKTATLNDIHENGTLLHQRQEQLRKKLEKYQWKKCLESYLPSCVHDDIVWFAGLINDLPDDEKFGIVKLCDFTNTVIVNSTKLFPKLFTPLNSFDEYEKMATVVGIPKISVYNAARWTTDVEFGRQMLNGVNPVVIKRCTELPPNFPVTNVMVKSSLNRGKTLHEEMEDGSVYICDLKIMDGLPTREGQYCTAPMCLLYVNANKQLVPIAIQLKQEEGEGNPIFLPSDHLVDWTLAKIYYQSAHVQFHQLSTHYYSCHAAMETYAVATMRNLPDPHPIYKLLCPHFRYTMAINTAARASLVNQGGIIDQLFAIGGEGKVKLLQEVSKHYRVHWTHIVKHAKERGVDDRKKLPGYYYRDDGIKIWRAIEGFVRGIIDEFYKADKDVIDDPELQNWADDIHVNGFPSYFDDENGHGFPSQIVTKEELTEYCTLIIFTGSAQHASVNFGQYDIYSFVPNAPTTLRLPPPSKKGVAQYATLFDTLPDIASTAKQIFLANLLSQYSQDEIYLGSYPSGIFTEENVQPKIAKFKEKLKQIEEEIKSRNKDLDVPYTYMMPTGIPNSITI